MSSFTAPLRVEQVDGRNWRLIRDVRYYLHEPGGDEIVVPAGKLTDFASIPRPFWPVIGHPAGEYAAAAVVHDGLYRGDAYWTAGDYRRTWTRREADRVFREGMAVLGVARWRRWAMWAAVRVGGYWAWRS